MGNPGVQRTWNFCIHCGSDHYTEESVLKAENLNRLSNKGYTLSTKTERSMPVFMEKKKKKKEVFDPRNLKPEEMLKFEIAEELGLGDKVIREGWRSLTAKESGRIGGLITKRKKEMKKAAMEQEEE